VEKFDGLKEEKVLLSCEGSFARAWTGLLGLGGLSVWWRGKGKRKDGLWLVGCWCCRNYR